MPRIVLALLLTVAVVTGLVLAHRRHRLVLAAASMLVLLTAAWTVAFAAAAGDFHDADGFIDCWPHCSALQDSVGISLFYAPVLALLIVVVTVVIAFRSRS